MAGMDSPRDTAAHAHDDTVAPAVTASRTVEGDFAETSNVQGSAAKKLIRGSSLLTLGRVIAVLLNFIVQVVLVRCLAKADYGAFAYGLAVVSMGASVAVFGLGRTLNRFAPMFQEQRQFGRMAGTVLLTLICVSGIGVGLVLLVWGTQAFISDHLVSDPRSMMLMVVLIPLVPLRALDSIFDEMFATFARPKDLFVRRHLIGPLLKMMAVVPLLFVHSNARWLAVSFVVCGCVGTFYSAVVLWQVLRKANLLQHFQRKQIDVPAREIFGFSVPMMSTDLLVIVRGSLVTLVLEFCHGAVGVAAFRAVLPVARLNSFVADSFRLLFSPLISRMFARGENDSIDDVFWRTAAWIAVGTFPLFLACVCLDEWITTTLFGREYADSGEILSLLACGFYVSAVLGLNNEILKAHGYVGRIFRTDMLTVAAAVLLNFWLVPTGGAIGGAISTVIVLLMRPIGNQITIFRLKLMQHTDGPCLRLFAVLLGIALIAWLFPNYVIDTFTVRLSVTLIGSLAALLAAMPVLELRTMFPEVRKLNPFYRAARAEGAG
ncbi:MAG: hypothetical protein Fues2KO_42720 [Fuerstiella sp.]